MPAAGRPLVCRRNSPSRPMARLARCAPTAAEFPRAAWGIAACGKTGAGVSAGYRPGWGICPGTMIRCRPTVSPDMSAPLKPVPGTRLYRRARNPRHRSVHRRAEPGDPLQSAGLSPAVPHGRPAGDVQSACRALPGGGRRSRPPPSADWEHVPAEIDRRMDFGAIIRETIRCS